MHTRRGDALRASKSSDLGAKRVPLLTADMPLGAIRASSHGDSRADAEASLLVADDQEAAPDDHASRYSFLGTFASFASAGRGWLLAAYAAGAAWMFCCASFEARRIQSIECIWWVCRDPFTAMTKRKIQIPHSQIVPDLFLCKKR